MGLGRAGVGLLCLVAAFAGQGELPPELSLLARIKQRMAHNLSRAPNYTCLETIERSARDHPSQRFRTADRLRLEVALVNRKELFSWPGAEKFEEKSLNDLVGGGTTTTGDFALHARAVFLSRAPTFAYVGEEIRQGRRTVHYSYRVSRLLSGYNMEVGDRRATVGFHGNLWVDRETLDLIRLEVRADDVPSDLGVSEAITEIEYGNVRVADSEFLLPQSVVFTMKQLSGEERRNHTVFTGCRQYVGRAVLSFEEAPGEHSAAPNQPAKIELPAGLSLDARLATAIDSQKAAVGDPITATVAEDVKKEGKVIVPKGAVLAGRIRRLERRFGRTEHYMVGLEFSSLQFQDKRAGFFADLEQIGPISGVSAKQPPVLAFGEKPGVGMIFIRGSRCRLPRGFQMVWRTTGPSKE